MDNNKKPFIFTIWDDLTDNEGVVLLQLLHEHTAILAKRVAVTTYHRDQLLHSEISPLKKTLISLLSCDLTTVDMETLSEKILAMRAEQVYETVLVQENASN